MEKFEGRNNRKTISSDDIERKANENMQKEMNESLWMKMKRKVKKTKKEMEII